MNPLASLCFRELSLVFRHEVDAHTVEKERMKERQKFNEIRRENEPEISGRRKEKPPQFRVDETQKKHRWSCHERRGDWYVLSMVRVP
jgi:hypothetical protein